MDITLKKAHKIVSELQSKIKQLESKNVHRLGCDNLAAVREEMIALADKNADIVNRNLRIVELIGYLRKSIKKENLRAVASSESVEDIMYRKAQAEEIIRTLRNYNSRNENDMDELIANKWKEAQEAKTDKGSLYSQAQQYLSFPANVSPTFHNELLEKVKKAKEEQEYCVNRLGVLNNTLTVVLTDDDVDLLKDVDII